jgi:hypothetical protein
VTMKISFLGCSYNSEYEENVLWDAFTEVTRKSNIFWNVMPCSLLQVFRLFRVICFRNIQIERTNELSTWQETNSKLSGAAVVFPFFFYYLLGLLLTWRWM